MAIPAHFPVVMNAAARIRAAKPFNGLKPNQYRLTANLNLGQQVFEGKPITSTGYKGNVKLTIDVEVPPPGSSGAVFRWNSAGEQMGSKMNQSNASVTFTNAKVVMKAEMNGQTLSQVLAPPSLVTRFMKSSVANSWREAHSPPQPVVMEKTLTRPLYIEQESGQPTPWAHFILPDGKYLTIALNPRRPLYGGHVTVSDAGNGSYKMDSLTLDPAHLTTGKELGVFQVDAHLPNATGGVPVYSSFGAHKVELADSVSTGARIVMKQAVAGAKFRAAVANAEASVATAASSAPSRPPSIAEFVESVLSGQYPSSKR